MTPLMKGFMLGTAAVAVALFFGFGGGVLLAEWLNETPQKQTRIEKVQEKDGKTSSGSELAAGNEEPKGAELKRTDHENPLIPKKVTTEAVTATPTKITPSLPFSPAPIGPPQTLALPSEAAQVAGPTSAPAVSGSAQADYSRSPKRQAEQTVPLKSQSDAKRREAKRRQAPDKRTIKPERQRREAKRNQTAKASRREPAETTGTASRHEDIGLDDDGQTRGSNGKNIGREVRRNDGDAHFEQRQAAPLRPLFGLFGL